MKESEITVTMPMNSYKELILYKENYYKLKDEIKSCLNTEQVENNVVILNLNKIIQLCKKELPIKYQNCSISVEE